MFGVCCVSVQYYTVCSGAGLYHVSFISHELPHCGVLAAAVAISLDQTTYSILENEQVVMVTLRLNDTYPEDIVVNVAVGELQGGCTYIQESSEHVICRQWWRVKCG